MAKGIKRKVANAYESVQREIYLFSKSASISGLASEGYNGGYADALQDVLLALNGTTPNRNNWWDETPNS